MQYNAMQGKTRQGKAGQGKARQGKARHILLNVVFKTDNISQNACIRLGAEYLQCSRKYTKYGIQRNDSERDISKTVYVEYTQILDRAHIKHKGTRHLCLGLPSLENSISSSNSTLVMAGSKLTRSFHILDPRYKNVRSPLLVVFRLGRLVSYVVLLNLNRSWRHSAFIWWNDLNVPIINNFSLYKSKEEDPFCEVFLRTWIQMCQEVCEAIALGSFPISVYLSIHKSAILKDSIKSCSLWNYWNFFFFFNFISTYFEILANALSCLVALGQQALTWSLNVNQ